MKRKDVGTAFITRVDYPNKGRFTIEETGEQGIVKNTIPGQTVRFRVYKKHGGLIYGNRLEVTEPSPLETRAPLCDNFGLCGGCLYQTMPYASQLEMKVEQMQRLLSDVLSEDTLFDGIKASPHELEYRNKLDLSFGDAVAGGPLTLGMHKMATRYTVLDADSCVLAHPDLRAILKEVRAFCAEEKLPHYNKLSHIGFLRYLMLRRSETSGEILMVLAASSQMEVDFSPLVDRLLALPLAGSFAGIFHAVDDRYADALIADEVRCLYGRDYFYESLLGLRCAEVLYDTVRSYVRQSRAETAGEKPVLYDLYCGTGTIAQIMAEESSRVYGIELVEEAVEAARRNAELNGLTNCTFLSGDVFETLPQIPEKPDYVILDPPREGVHEKALRKILDYGISDMVYISCKASSFAEDMRYLKKQGWKIQRYTLVDMFPETQHIETVCLLSKLSGAKHHVSITLDMEEMDLTAAESKATYQEIQEWVQEKYGFHVSHLNIAKTKRKCGIIERKNYNLPKSEDSWSPETPKEKEEAIREAFKYFQMID